MPLQSLCFSEPKVIQFPILWLYITQIDSILGVENSRNNELETGK